MDIESIILNTLLFGGFLTILVGFIFLIEGLLKENDKQFFTYGIVMLIGFLLSWLSWARIEGIPYTNLLIVSSMLVGSVLVAFLIVGIISLIVLLLSKEDKSKTE